MRRGSAPRAPASGSRQRIFPRGSCLTGSELTARFGTTEMRRRWKLAQFSENDLTEVGRFCPLAAVRARRAVGLRCKGISPSSRRAKEQNRLRHGVQMWSNKGLEARPRPRSLGLASWRSRSKDRDGRVRALRNSACSTSNRAERANPNAQCGWHVAWQAQRTDP